MNRSDKILAAAGAVIVVVIFLCELDMLGYIDLRPVMEAVL